MPAPLRPNHIIERAIPPVFRPPATPRLPEARVETGTVELALCNSPLRLGPLRPLPLLVESSSSNAATFPSHAPAVLPRALAKPFACLPEAVGLIKLTCTPDERACTAEALKKISSSTDGLYEAANADRVYPRLGFELQPVWNAARIRLLLFHASVAPRNCTAGVRGSAEPEDASAWLASLKPRAGLVPAVWQVEECESIEAPGVVSTHRRLTGIEPVLRWWRNSNRTLKGGVIVFGCMLAFGLHSSISNPQPVSATTENAASAGVSGPLRVLQQSIANRAGVHLSDDFRTGLHAWEGGEDWSDSWSYDEAGFVHPGRLALYTPSLKMADYRMEFVGQISKKGLAWVVRAADVKNYVAVKLIQVSTGPRPRLAVVRYALVNGKEERHKQIVFPFEARTDTVYQVRMEVGGNRYSLYIQDRMADTWEDDRFTSGGVGFFSAKGEDARLRWVRITYQYDWVGRICAALAG
jgi:hypothetical protein